MNSVCVLAHGIETDPADRSWVEEVQARYQRITSMQLIPRKYGYWSGQKVWFSAFARREVVDYEEIYFRGVSGEKSGLLEDLEPDIKICYGGHSLGGYNGTALLKRGVKFHRMALLWSSSVADFQWASVEDNFDRVRVCYSPDDEILTASQVADGEDPELALGLLGKVGPLITHPRVESIKDPFGFKLHNQFMDFTAERDEFWADMFKWMEG